MSCQDKLNIIVTGASGFIGSYLVKHLLEKNNTVFSVSRNDSKNLHHLRENSKFICCEFSNNKSIKKIVEESEPDEIYHLASKTNVPLSWEDPITTFQSNVLGTLRLLEEVRKSKSDPKIHLLGASAEYGNVKDEDIPINENVRFSPTSPYAVSKLTMDMIGQSYWISYGMKISSRPFLIVGPG